MAGRPNTTNKPELTPEEVAAKRAEARRVKDQRQRVNLLRTVEQSIANARACLASGNMNEHATWLGIADDQLTSYTKVVALQSNSVTQGTDIEGR